MNLLLIAVGKHSLLLKKIWLAVLQKKRAHLLAPTGILFDVCWVNIYLLKLLRWATSEGWTSQMKNIPYTIAISGRLQNSLFTSSLID